MARGSTRHGSDHRGPGQRALTASDARPRAPAAAEPTIDPPYDLPDAAETAFRELDGRAAPIMEDVPFTSFAAFARQVRSTRGDPGSTAPKPAVATAPPVRPPAGHDEHDDASAAFRRLAAVLRTHHYGTAAPPTDPTVDACFRLAVGAEADRTTVDTVVGHDGFDALVDAGWAECGDLDASRVRLTMAVFAIGPILTVIPRSTPRLDTVYLGPDSLALLRRAWASTGGGRRAIDLATGNGFIAAAMATRFDHVVAADLSTRCVAAAALVPVLNPSLAPRVSVVQADVAAGLAAGTFDLVTANPPWVPEDLRGERDPARRFAAGGPTGFELPQRFLDATAGLLAPEGRGFVSCLDLELADGRRPLRDHLPTLEATGCVVEVHPSTMPGADDLRDWVKNRLGRVPAARHVIVEVRRRGTRRS